MAYSMKQCKGWRQWNSINEVASFIKDTPAHEGSGSESDSSGTFTFYGDCDNLNDAIDCAVNGWATGAQKIEALVENFDSKAKAERKDEQEEFDVVGPVPIIGEYLAGNPECMYNPQDPVRKPVVNVLLDLAANCMVDADNMLNRGFAVIALLQQLEEQGKDANVFVVSSVGSRGSFATELIKVKDSTEPLVLDFFTFCLAHPSMLRRIVFALRERLNDKTFSENMTSGGYGSSTNTSKIGGLEETMGDIDLYIPSADQREYNEPETAVKEVLRLAAKSGLIQA